MDEMLSLSGDGEERVKAYFSSGAGVKKRPEFLPMRMQTANKLCSAVCNAENSQLSLVQINQCRAKNKRPNTGSSNEVKS